MKKILLTILTTFTLTTAITAQEPPSNQDTFSDITQESVQQEPIKITPGYYRYNGVYVNGFRDFYRAPTPKNARLPEYDPGAYSKNLQRTPQRPPQSRI